MKRLPARKGPLGLLIVFRLTVARTQAARLANWAQMDRRGRFCLDLGCGCADQAASALYVQRFQCDHLSGRCRSCFEDLAPWRVTVRRSLLDEVSALVALSEAA